MTAQQGIYQWFVQAGHTSGLGLVTYLINVDEKPEEVPQKIFADQVL